MTRLNKVIEKLIAGEIVVSSPPVPASFEVAQAYGDSDFDAVVFEMEHYGFDFTGLRDSLYALLHRGRISQDRLQPSVVPFTRISPNSRETSQWIIKQTLDTGVYGLLVPHLETPEEAAAIVRAARYPARRGSSLGGGQRGFWPYSPARYWGVDTSEYLERADLWPLNPDGELLIIGIIETQEGVDNLGRILDSTNGIGAIWAGPGDLSASMGLLGDLDHPEVEGNVQRILRTCRDRGVPCVSIGRTTGEAVLRAEQGFQIIFSSLEPGVAAAARGAVSTVGVAT